MLLSRLYRVAVNFSRVLSTNNGQNDRVANIEDVVQWGLGLLHQQAIFEN